VFTVVAELFKGFLVFVVKLKVSDSW